MEKQCGGYGVETGVKEKAWLGSECTVKKVKAKMGSQDS